MPAGRCLGAAARNCGALRHLTRTSTVYSGSVFQTHGLANGPGHVRPPPRKKRGRAKTSQQKPSRRPSQPTASHRLLAIEQLHRRPLKPRRRTVVSSGRGRHRSMPSPPPSPARPNRRVTFGPICDNHDSPTAESSVRQRRRSSPEGDDENAPPAAAAASKPATEATLSAALAFMAPVNDRRATGDAWSTERAGTSRRAAHPPALLSPATPHSVARRRRRPGLPRQRRAPSAAQRRAGVQRRQRGQLRLRPAAQA